MYILPSGTVQISVLYRLVCKIVNSSPNAVQTKLCLLEYLSTIIYILNWAIHALLQQKREELVPNRMGYASVHLFRILKLPMTKLDLTCWPSKKEKASHKQLCQFLVREIAPPICSMVEECRLISGTLLLSSSAL